MGQKINPHGLRVGINKPWQSKWYADKKTFADNLVADNNIRTLLKKKYGGEASISKIGIERAADKVTVNIHTSRPAVLIGKAGAGVEIIKKEVQKYCGEKSVNINVMEVKQPDTDAQLLAEAIAKQLEGRTAFRRAMKQTMSRALKAGVKGVKTMVAGRLGGAEIARSESYQEGSIPRQTLRADIDYGFAEALTNFGIIGVKVWVYKGEILGKVKEGGND